MKKRIQEVVTFIRRTREEAITLANDIVGDAEVHTLVITKAFVPNPEPVGYMVVPVKEWVGLTDDEIKEIIGPWGDGPIKGYTRKLFDQIEAKLKAKNEHLP